MTPRAARRATLAAAIALVAALALLLGRNPTNEGTTPPQRHETVEGAPRLAASETAVAASERSSIERASSPPGAPPGSDPTASSEPAAPTYPTVAVRVLSERGTPVEAALVYALPAGSRGRNDEASVPHAETREDGTADLSLPAPGRYDVGALRNGRAFEEDVVVEGDRPVELRFRPPAEVHVSVSEAAAAQLGRDGVVSVRLSPAGEVPSLSFPGRDDPDPEPDWTRSTERRFRVPVPGPGEHEVRAHAAIPLRAVPPRVRGGAFVELTAAGYFVSLKVRFVPADRAFPERRLVRVDFALPGGATSPLNLVLFPGTPYSKMFGGAYVVRLESPEPAGTIRWSGPGVVPGSIDFTVGPTSSFEGTVDVEVAEPPVESRTSAGPAPPPVEAETPIRMRLRGPEAANLAGADVHYVSREDDGTASVHGAGVGEDGVELMEPAIVVVAVASTQEGDSARPGFVSAPTRPTEGGSIVLERGGFAVVVPVSEPPPGLTLRLARADGAPFLHRHRGQDGQAGGFVNEPHGGVEPAVGMVIGPLEPGVVRFAMRLGGVDAGEVTVQIRAGENSPLVLRPSPGRVGR